MKGRVTLLLAILLVVATLGVAQPARAIPLEPLALAFGLDMIRNRASQPVESSTVGMPSLSVNVHWDDGQRDMIIGGGNLSTQGLVVSAGCELEIEPVLMAKPGLTDLRAITVYSMRKDFPNLALVRPDFKEDLRKELTQGGEERKYEEASGGRIPWTLAERRERRGNQDSHSDEESPKVWRLGKWWVREVEDYTDWLVQLDTSELNGYYTPAIDFYFRNGTVPKGLLNLCRRGRADSLRSITALAVLRPEEIEAGLNSPGVQRALQYFSGGEFYVPPVTGGPSFRVTDPEVLAMIAESQPPPVQAPLPSVYPQAGPSFRDPRPVPPFPTEGRREWPRQDPAMPGSERGEATDYWEQEVPVPPAQPVPEAPDRQALLVADEQEVLTREAEFFGYPGELLRQSSYRVSRAGNCPYENLTQPLHIFIVEEGRVLHPITVEMSITRSGQHWTKTLTAPKGIQIISGLEPGDELVVSWRGQTLWQGQVSGPGMGLWLPVVLSQ